MGGAMASSSSRLHSFFFLSTILFLTSCLVTATEILYRVPEEQPPDILIGSLASDHGLPDSGHMYKLEVGAPYLRIDENTGDIYTTDFPIDRETMKGCRDLPNVEKCFLDFEVSVTDGISEPRLLKGRIEVLDINDNTPQFPSHLLTLSIPENTQVGALFAIPWATDRDSRANGVDRYSLSMPFYVKRLFRLQVELDTDSGEMVPQLLVKGFLDREETDSYNMNIQVVDGGTPDRQSSALLRVIITDENDNAPVFEKSHYKAELQENSPPGHAVLQVRATDADIGVNGEISYSFHKSSETVQKLLQIDNSTGLITVKNPVDREETNSLHIFVVAQDRGSKSLSSSVYIPVNIKDQNDNAPSIEIRGTDQIKHHNGVANIAEDTPIGTAVAQVKVSDRDEGENGAVSCTVIGDVPFELRIVNESANERKYILQTSRLLDYELVRDYRVEIVAVDSGEPALSSRLSLKMQIVDINDNAPVFLHKVFEVDFAEENQPGEKVLDATADDADIGTNAELFYSIVEEPARQVFEIDSASGEIRARSVLDREEIERYEFRVTAAEKGEPRRTGTATVIINVLDRNDNTPKFMLKSYSFSVLENLPPPNPVGVVMVTDADKGENARVELFVEPDDGNFFIQNGTGTILSSISFDREKESTYTFRLKAVDCGERPRSAYAGVTVNILDENDNAPHVIKPSNSSYTYLPLQTPPETTIGVVEAKDLDLGINSELVFTLMGGNPHKLFHISSTSGSITLAKKFTSKHNGLHRLVVKVSDKGKPQRHTTALVHVFVGDTKSNVPQMETLVTHSLNTPLDRDISGDSTTVEWSNILYWGLAGIAGVILVIIVGVVIYHYLKRDSKSGSQVVYNKGKN